MEWLSRADAGDAARILGAAFRGNRFYHAALGFDDASFAGYWECLVALALRDRGARTLGLRLDGRLYGVLLCGIHGFPSPVNGARFLLALARRVGPRRWLRYLRFVADYDRAMRRPAADRPRETRGLWLAVDPAAPEAGLGAALVRECTRRMCAEGRPLVTAFVDAGNRPLLALYRRLGFTTLRRLPFAGLGAAVLELRADAPAPRRGGGAPC
jgi:ribosomal protein S18 acetylase RimI-like enzyme